MEFGVSFSRSSTFLKENKRRILNSILVCETIVEVIVLVV